MIESSVRIARGSGYTVVQNNAVRDPRLSLSATGLYVRMMSLPGGKPHSVKYISKVAGCGRDALRRCFGELEAAGYLVREQTHVEHGKFGVNAYALYDTPISPSTGFPSTAEPATADPTTADPATENPPAKEITGKRNHTPPKSPQEGNARAPATPKWRPERFEAFWGYYRTTFCAADHRRAGNRAPAAKAWDKLKPGDETIGAIGKALVATMQTEQWGRGIGIAYASTYLNGRYWEDVDLAPGAGREAPREQEAWGWQ